jgi:hypothetical protein
LIKWLNDCATRAQFCYSHRWRVGDPVIRDKSCVLYRATACDTLRHQPLMQRATVAGDRPTTAPPARYELAAELATEMRDPCARSDFSFLPSP